MPGGEFFFFRRFARAPCSSVRRRLKARARFPTLNSCRVARQAEVTLDICERGKYVASRVDFFMGRFLHIQKLHTFDILPP